MISSHLKIKEYNRSSNDHQVGRWNLESKLTVCSPGLGDHQQDDRHGYQEHSDLWTITVSSKERGI